MRIRRLVGVAAMMTIVVAAPAMPAVAAPPPNDTAAGATSVSIGFSATIETSEATTDSDDAQLNESCGAPATDASVWYTYQPAADETILIDVRQSNYSAGILIGVGTVGALQTVACAPGATFLAAAAGETYYLLAIDDQSDGGGNGGQLTISISEAPPAPTLELTVDRVGHLDRQGNASISGTYRCENGDFIELFAEVLQIQRRRAVRGFFDFFAAGTCDGRLQPWAGLVVPESGRFIADRALVMSFGFVCGEFECADGYVEQVVRLRPPRDSR